MTDPPQWHHCKRWSECFYMKQWDQHQEDACSLWLVNGNGSLHLYYYLAQQRIASIIFQNSFYPPLIYGNQYCTSSEKLQYRYLAKASTRHRILKNSKQSKRKWVLASILLSLTENTQHNYGHCPNSFYPPLFYGN